MIVISDDEDDVEETTRNEKIEKRQVNMKSTSLVTKHSDKSSDSEDDVCVVGQVTHFKKYPKGSVLGSFRSHVIEPVQLGSIKKRRRPDLIGVKHCSIRRERGCSNLHILCSSAAIRRLFHVEEVIRLEERLKYFELLDSIFRGVNIQNISSSLVRNLKLDGSLLLSLKQNSFARTPPKTKPPKVECIDLTSDAESDVSEIAEDIKSCENDVKELPHDLENNVIDLEEDYHFVDVEMPTSSFKKSKGKEYVCPSSSRQQQDHLSVKSVEIQPFSSVDENVSKINNRTLCASPSDSKGNLEERMLHQMNINDNVVIDLDDNDNELSDEEEEKSQENEETEESFPVFTQEMQLLVHKAFMCPSSKFLIEAFRIPIHGKDILTLKGSSWLNDQVINFYMCLLMERGKESSYPSVYCFNTFFYVKLLESGFASLRRWTQKVDVFSYELLIVPVHLKVHWCLACVNFIEKRIEYYDSMGGGAGDKCAKTLLKYLEEEYYDKKAEIFDCLGWKLVNMEDIPEQLNGSDCGVFVCTYAEYICRLAKLTFTQKEMPYFRVKMAYEILTKKLML